ncbi:DNA polymerase III subunit epsilon [Pseudomonas fluorescens]|uniref:DNA polymerase III subunit epsilon n=1 Tax=Pseudomonas TaxID=286 RepID=UPI000F014676|nr:MULTISPECIES: DNA polymerase III subunit epsilon [Pseudomonas]MBD8089293.1 DNA polymerase III subunit epsilon [Pseudomonas fluorescens]MBD8682066.1 DNA polymerase III subunit epsilon [Pseudomonas sp. CFBP 13719]
MSNAEKLLVFDTETTGFDPKTGDRMVEVGFVELIDRKRTGRILHLYFDPERDVPEGAFEVHGLSRDELVKLSKGKKFADHAQEMIDFMSGAVLVAHNSRFDEGFFDAEFERAGYGKLKDYCEGIIDSLAVASLKRPGKQNSLDALLRDYVGKDNYSRDLHGALLDADLLAQVYLLMTVAQDGLSLDTRLKSSGPVLRPARLDVPTGALSVVSVDEASMERHNALSERIKKASGGSVVELGFG